ncbi:MAG TPA: phosphoribosyltransferase family protein [Flavisolibacter sp.]|nr:phosphoribosyltransferase family protein [Flavisolibacter sp.]
MLRLLTEALLHLAYPHVCEGCGSDVLPKDQLLCLRCLSSLPLTGFHLHADNPVEKMFWGRLPLTAACAQYYFTKRSLMQGLLHQLKYRGNRDAGLYLGRLMGYSLLASSRFCTADLLLPMPLFRAREKRRGYNQAEVICRGISEVMQKPVRADIVIRSTGTDSQTKKGRIARWQNMEGRFELTGAAAIEHKQVLLVDDVITTGASLEALGRTLLPVEGIRLSIAALCFTLD